MNLKNYAEDDQAEFLRAQEYLEQGEQLGSEGNIRTAINLYMMAVEIYLNIGAYLQISKVFDQLTSLVTGETQILVVMEQIRETIETIEYLDLPEELAKLKLSMANLHYKLTDYLNAGNLYIEVAELFNQVDPDEYHQLSGMFLLKAAECFEKIDRFEKTEKLIIEAIMRFDSSIFNFPEHQQHLVELIHGKKYENAVDELREIAEFFRNLEKELEKMEDKSDTFRNLKNNVNARLIHMVSEYNLIKMLCYRHLHDEEKVKAQAEKSVKDLSYAIEVIKMEINEGYYSPGDLHRITFDQFLLQIFQEFADYQVEDPLDLVMRGIPNEVKEIIRKMQFYEYTVQLLEFDLKECKDLFDDIPLSQVLDPFREFIQKSI